MNFRLAITAELLFTTSNTSIVKLTATNTGSDAVPGARFVFGGTATNLTKANGSLAGVDFVFLDHNLPGPCFSPDVFMGGGLRLSPCTAGGGQALAWEITVADGGFVARSNKLSPIAPGSAVTTYAAVSSVSPGLSSAATAFATLLSCKGGHGSTAAVAFNATQARWLGYLSDVLEDAPAPTPPLDANMRWTAVKALQTLMNNWRVVPGIGEGVLPSYNNYGSGFWSWDTYKQAVGMLPFAPNLAKEQLRLLVAGRDRKTDHIPDKVQIPKPF